MRRLREWLAFKIAPWVYVPYREEREEAFRDLAEVAYMSRDAIWTSPRTLVAVALRESRSQSTTALPPSPPHQKKKGRLRDGYEAMRRTVS